LVLFEEVATEKVSTSMILLSFWSSMVFFVESANLLLEMD
jgi:hypothetical protein